MGTPTGPDLLVGATAVLPSLAGRGRVRCVAVHDALYQAACMMGMGRDRPHRLRLAGEAFELFAAYLANSGRATARPDPDPDPNPAGAWLARADLAEVQLALAAAAGYWLRELDATPASQG